MFVKRLLATAVLLQLLLLLTPAVKCQLSNKPFHSDIPGDFCATRSDPCCVMRQDDCSVPILGTLCYCDEFCNRVINPDCCPDYSPVCMGISPTKPPEGYSRCNHNGQYVNQHDVIEDNCNTCTCEKGGKMSCTQHACLIEPQMLRNLELQQGLEWQPTNYSIFWGRRRDEGMLHRTGTKKPAYRPTRFPVILHFDPDLIPREFDARTKWPGLVSEVMDQGWCGSSWAMSTTAVASDRISIRSGANILLSSQNILDCGMRGQQGCEGGRVQTAWNFLWKFGSVLDSCYPYISGATEKAGSCLIKRSIRATSVSCDSPQLVYTGRDSPIYRTQPAHRISSRVPDIQYEIMNDGPVLAVMRVRQDFFLYRNGVYYYTGPADAPMQYHSVKLIGWGVETTNLGYPIPYWLAVNSWGKNWGEDGLFRIRRGMNESGIEEHIIAVRRQIEG